MSNELIKLEDTYQVSAVPHPFRTQRITLDIPYGLTIREMLDRVCGGAPLRDEFVVFCDGEIIPPENWARIRPKPGVRLEAHATISGLRGGGGKSPLRIVLMLAVMVAAFYLGPMLAVGLGMSTVTAAGAVVATSFGAALGTALVSSVGALLINAIAPIRAPKSDSLTDRDGRDSQTLFIEQARNRLVPFAPVPQILGRHRMVPPLAAQPFTETVASQQYVRMLLVWGIGPLAISDLKIGNTPITNYSDVQVETKFGYPADTPHTIFPEQIIQDNFNVMLTAAGSWATKTAPGLADELSVDLSCPGGVVYIDDKGKKQPISLQMELEYRLVGAGGWSKIDTSDSRFTTTLTSGLDLSGSTLNTFYIEGATTAAVRHALRWGVTRGNYEVRIRRLAADSDDNQLADDTYWTAFRIIRNEDPINFPVKLATTAIVIRATDQLNGVPDEINAVVQTVCPDWNGSTWVTQATSNPASLFRYVLQGAGRISPLPDARIDLANLQSWHAFCVAKGFKFNMVRDFRSSVWETLADIANAGRASPTFIDGKWGVVYDQPQATAVSHITPRNSWGFTAEKAFIEAPHAWRIAFPNELEDWRQDERIVYMDGYTSANATNYETLEFPGVTNPNQIWALGRYYGAVISQRPERWSFEQDMEYIVYNRGDKVLITHDVIAVGLKAGRVKAIAVDGSNNVTGITSDEVLTMENGKNYGISIRTPSNTAITKQVTTVAGDQTVITFTTSIPNVGGQPAISVEDLFGFGILGAVTEDGIVVAIEPGPRDMTARTSVVPYRSAVYDVDSEAIPGYSPNLQPLVTIPALVVRTIRSNESVLTLGPGETLRVRVSITYLPLTESGLIDLFVDVQGRLAGSDGPYQDMTVEYRGPTEIIMSGFNTAEVWDFRLRWRSANRAIPGEWVYIYSHTVVGKSTPPGALSNASLSAIGGTALIRWDLPVELDVRYGGEVRFRHTPDFITLGTDPNTVWAQSASIGEAANSRDRLASLPLKPGTYLARVYDTVGLGSDVIMLVTKQATSLTYTNLSSIDEDTVFSGSKTDVIVASGELKLDIVGGGNNDVLPLGTYLFNSSFDFTSVTRKRLTSRIAATVTNTQDLIDDRRLNIDTWEDFDGTVVAAADCRVYERHTDDDPGGSPTWTAWQRLDSAEFQARAFQFKAILTSDDPAFNIMVSDLGIDSENL